MVHVRMDCDDTGVPYIIYLTTRQEEELRKYFRQTGWQIKVFKYIHQDFQFLVDLMIQDEKLARDTLKKYKGNRIARKMHYAGTCKRGKRKDEIQSSDLTEYIDINARDNENNSDYVKGKLDQDQISTNTKDISTTIQCSNIGEELKDESSFLRNVKERHIVEILPDVNMQDQQHGEGIQEEQIGIKIYGKVDITTEHRGNSDAGSKTNERTKRILRSSTNVTQRKNLDRYKLKQLANIAARKTNFSCEICGKVAASEQHLKRHTDRLHSEEALKKKEDEKKRKQGQEVTACHICRKQFADKYALNTHHRNMHSEKKTAYQCDLCGAVLKHMGNLVQHKKSLHSDTRPHKCDLCGSKFKLHQHLKTHKRRHDPDFVETCTICGKTLRKGHLSTHMKRHTNDRKFKCDKCGKTFYEKQDLERHVILHSGEKPNKCPFCPYACAFKGNLTKHLNIRHDIELKISKLQTSKSNTITSNGLKKGSKVNHESARGQVNSFSRSNYNAPIITTSSSLVPCINVGHSENNNSCNGNKSNMEDVDSINITNHVYCDDIRKTSESTTSTLSEIDYRGEQITSDVQLENLI